MNLQSRLSACLADSGLNQSQLARRAGVTPASINRLINGESHEFSCPSIFVIARVLNVDAEWLATGRGSPLRKTGVAESRDPILDVLDAMPPQEAVYWRSRLATELLGMRRARRIEDRRGHGHHPPVPKAKGAG